VATIDLTKDNFKETVEKCDVIFIEFFAPWCGHCQAFTPLFKRVSDKYPDAVFALVDVTAQDELANEMTIHGVPTIIIYKKNEQVLKQAGAVQEKKLEGMVEEYCKK
jgi:thioredoxin 1